MTTLQVKINDVAVDVKKVEISFKGLTIGHSLATILVDDTDVFTYDINKIVEIKTNVPTIFKGRLDTANRDISSERKWNWLPIMRVSARDLSQEFSNLKVTKVYFGAWKADDLIEDLLSEAGSTITYTSASAAPTIENFIANDEYLITLIKRILEQVGWEGYVDTAGALQLFDATNPPDSGVTIGGSDCFSQNYFKDGLGIRNKIKIKGAPLTFDPANKDNCESLTDWTAIVGNLTLATGTIGSYCIQCEAISNAGRTMTFYLSKPFKATFDEERNKLNLIIQQALSGTPAPTYASGGLRLFDSDGDYFYIDFEPADSPYWTVIDEILGVNNEYIVEENETGWKLNGTPLWLDIQKIQFEFAYTLGSAASALVRVDGLYLEPVKWKKTVSNPTSIATYDERQLTLERPELLTQAAVDDYADEQLILYKDYIYGWRVLKPAEPFIVSDVWKALIGNKVMFGATPTRLVGATVTCAPKENLKSGYDFICNADLLPLTARRKIHLYDITLNPNHLKLILKE